MVSKSDKTRNKYYQKTYGITLEDYNSMLQRQGYSCALCKKHQFEFKTRLAVEHNHKTGKVRALACFRCNKFIIGRHNLQTATSLYEYMVKYDK